MDRTYVQRIKRYEAKSHMRKKNKSEHYAHEIFLDWNERLSVYPTLFGIHHRLILMNVSG